MCVCVHASVCVCVCVCVHVRVRASVRLLFTEVRLFRRPVRACALAVNGGAVESGCRLSVVQPVSADQSHQIRLRQAEAVRL